MNFFDAQDSARRATRRLVIVYILSTLLIVAGVTAVIGVVMFASSDEPIRIELLVFIALLATLLIVGATLYKTARLSSGGGRVALDMGGTPVPPDTTDPLLRRLRNVVEEMAIASGVPVPDLYVLEQETGINAFAAGFSPGDAAIAVTRGTLELLDRDELQGVIAHEFSHVLNGDMRLNIRMMGVLFGIMVLGLIGRMILRGGYHGSLIGSRRGRGSGTALAIGLGLVVIGGIGVFMARLTKAAISRQREKLADASAVQFTRQTDGLAGALKKIGGFSQHSHFQAADPEEVSHMLFAHGAQLAALFATHPPLVERIRALEPGFREEDMPRVVMPATPEDGDDRAQGFAAAAAPAGAAAGMADRIGNPGAEEIAWAGRLRATLPETLYDAAHSEHSAWLLVLALFIDADETAASKAHDILTQQLGEARAGRIRAFHRELAAGGREWRLPILELAHPVLKRAPDERRQFLLDLCQRLVEMDGRLTLHEFCLFRVLERQLDEARDPARRERRASKDAVRRAALELLAIVAEHGHDDPAARERAFAAGCRAFGQWAHDEAFAPVGDAPRVLAESLDTLERRGGAARRTLVDAVAAAVSADERLAPREAELLRAICATLRCPLPPLALDDAP